MATHLANLRLKDVTRDGEGMFTTPPFRRFVLYAYSKRITDLFLTVEEIACGRMDVRPAAQMLELADKNDQIAVNHGVRATELGTARVVVSHQSPEFQRRAWIAQHRGAVQLADRAAPENLRHGQANLIVR
ncbi:cyclic nucleotide-binding domain-containing protein [Tateyamaria pelophila]|uniref:hypothetical protein n=1 Tax=Tateyamaria pelophila TaxID=328415 RepID=UPI001CC0ACBE|nr:hypothetical protein [Tateyamaria pelophila]